MEAILIPPIPDLNHAICQGRFLLLPHLLKDPTYVAFHQAREAEGKELILDNGADEFGRSVPFREMLEHAARMRVAEIVLPDVQYDAQETFLATSNALDLLMTDHEARSTYERAGCPRLMVVPQGTDYHSWVWCYTKLVGVMEDFASRNVPGGDPASKFILGIPKNMDSLVHGGIQRLLMRLPNNIWADRVHLLGWPKRLMTLNELAVHYPGLLRSVDSARPFSYAHAGLDISDPRVRAGRGADRVPAYFSLRTQNPDVLERNIKQFHRFAAGLITYAKER